MDENAPTPKPHLFSDVLARVEAYLRSSGLAETTFGKNAARDDGFVSRLREGRVTYRIAQRALDYIAAQESAMAAPASTGTGLDDTAQASRSVRRAERAPDVAADHLLGAGRVAIVAPEAENGAVTQ